jgi:hypothetical protein
MLFQPVIAAIMQRLIALLKRLAGNFAHCRVNQQEPHGEFWEPEKQIPDGFHTSNHLALT